MTDPLIREFVAQQRQLLDLELQSEQNESKSDDQAKEQSASHILGFLEASDISIGLFGRTVVELEVWNASTSTSTPSSTKVQPPPGLEGHASSAPSTLAQKSTVSPISSSSQLLLPAHRFTVGDEVEIRSKQSNQFKKKGRYPGGVICALSNTSVSVALFSSNNNKNNDNKKAQQQPPKRNAKKFVKKNKNNNNNDDEDDDNDIETDHGLGAPPLSLVPQSSVEVHRKLLRALGELEKYGVDHPLAGRVVQAMFHPQDFSFVPTTTTTSSSDSTAASPAATSSSSSSSSSTTNQSKNNKKQDYTLPFNPNLDNSQLEAIAFGLRQNRPVALIHGPPGTGKTTTIAELIRQAVHVHGLKVLVTAPSNVAVDNILERLVAASSSSSSTTTARRTKLPTLNAVRLGHPARIKSSILPYSLEALVQSAEGTEIVQDVRKELQYFLKVLSNPNSKSNDKRLAYRELKGLRSEIRTREEQVVKDLMTRAQVVLATTVGAANDRILNPLCRGGGDNTNPSGGGGGMDEGRGFDLVIIDEAAQALEASCWIPIFRGKRVVLAGDHCQLPPTIKSHSVQAQVGLGRTMFERVLQLYGDDYQHDVDSTAKKSTGPPRVSRMLKVQYRMHQDIANWASQAMYRGQLLTHESVRDRSLKQLIMTLNTNSSEPHPPKAKVDNHHDDGTPLDQTTMLLVDTAGCEMYENVTAAGSRLNHGEAEIVASHVRRLLDLGIPQREIAIITPYNGQVELLRSLLLVEFPQLEIRSVDGFQGGEREAVVLSLVRSSDPSSRGRGSGSSSSIGFLKDDRRQNVAVTRAKRHLAVICDSDTVSQSKFIQNLLSWIEAHGEQRSAMDFVAEKELESDLRHAETELLKMVKASLAVHDSGNNSKTKQNKKPESQGKSNTMDEQKLGEAQRKALLDEISKFSETGSPGQEMALSSELSSYDRRVVHEFAEQNGLGHRSEGEGSSRRIILTVNEKAAPVVPAPDAFAPVPEKEQHPVVEDDHLGRPSHVGPSFAALLDASSSSDNSDDESDMKEIAHLEGLETSSSVAAIPSANQMLADLAKERAEREKAKQAAATTTAKGKQNSKQKKNAQTLGGGGGAKKQVPVDKSLDELDDMSFLDAQIDLAQNSHGRIVAGKGKNYRTVVNGILNAKPESSSSSASKNAKASATLRGKLQQAQDGRKQKPTKKKKK